MKKISAKYKIIYIVTVTIILISLITLTYGRYIYNSVRDFYLASKSFYFESDKLTVNRAIYQVDNWSAVDPFSITINLNNNKNNLVRANSDITYEISYVCSDNILCNINSIGGTLYTEPGTTNFTALITPNATFQDGDEAFMEITVQSTSPYKKTLKGRFILKVGKSGLYYSIDDKTGSPYLNFNITNTLDYYLVKEAFDNYSVNDRIDRITYSSLSEENKSKCVSSKITLTFNPEIVILDTTSTAYIKKETYTTTTINGYEYINSITFNMDSESSEVVKFYKANTNINYTYPIINDNSIITFNHTE